MNRVKAYAQLLRIPNVFTAMADVAMAWMILHFYSLGVLKSSHTAQALDSFRDDALAVFDPYLVIPDLELPPLPRVAPWFLAVLLFATSCFYSGGMALNDFFDAEEDKRDRPFRPIPSSRISRGSAAIVGFGLLLIGLVPFVLLAIQYLPALLIPVALVLCIVAYDGWLKRTPFAPLGMGTCRFLNVMMGLGPLVFCATSLIAGFGLIVGLYIFGVTWFAKTETAPSERSFLSSAAVVMLGSVLIATALPLWVGVPSGIETAWFLGFLAVWSVIVGRPIVSAIVHPDSKLIQRAVKTCILGLIGLDAILAFSIVGWWGLSILVLLIPAVVLGRWVYST